MSLVDHEAFCEICQKFLYKVDDKWIFFYNNKYPIYCSTCWGILFNNCLEPKMSEETRSKKEKTTKNVQELNIQWDNIDSMITEGSCKINKLAKDLNVNVIDLRKMIQAHYGTRIFFKKGRRGGVYWNK
jgi:hypothetical protein